MAASQYGEEFKEIGHCGGQYIVKVKTDKDGRRSYQVGVTHSRPTAASIIGVYALPQGIPVGIIQFAGIGSGNSSLNSGCYPVFIGSDTHGMFGHQCPTCKGYWRSEGHPTTWNMTCPYCGFRDRGHSFLTEGQLKYVEGCCDLIEKALQAKDDGEHVINMDEVAEAVGKGGAKPQFYYTEEKQQNKHKCSACGAVNDILGRYGYCSNCGYYNGLSELEKDINGIRARIGTGNEFETYVGDAVSAFDSYAHQIAKQLVARVPMTLARKGEWGRRKFHNLKSCAESLSAHFDIDILKNIGNDDIEFADLMFHRRHVYEHNGGVVDDKYIHDSGDTSVRLGQVIREGRNTALRTADIVLKLGRNLHDGFHAILPPEKSHSQPKRQRDNEVNSSLKEKQQ